MSAPLKNGEYALEKCDVEFRFATAGDIPEIVSLLKLGLGENSIPKSELYWRWKHEENPFGPSFTLLAIDQKGVIVGVRTFMRWRWKSKDKILEAVRGVDTVMHPDYQGKGIFGKLTLLLKDQCREKGLQFLFSTPNKRSRRGYEKLGWELAGRLPVHLKFVRPVSMMLNLVNKPGKQQTADRDDGSVEYYLNHPYLAGLISRNDANNALRFSTDHTVESLRWRYACVPVLKYYAIGVEQGDLNGLLFYRIKNTRIGRELRITDVFLDSPERAREMKMLLKKKIREHQIDYVTSGGLEVANIIDSGLSLADKRIGPTVLIHKIHMLDLKCFTGFEAWSASLGDLELF